MNWSILSSIVGAVAGIVGTIMILDYNERSDMETRIIDQLERQIQHMDERSTRLERRISDKIDSHIKRMDQRDTRMDGRMTALYTVHMHHATRLGRLEGVVYDQH